MQFHPEASPFGIRAGSGAKQKRCRGHHFHTVQARFAMAQALAGSGNDRKKHLFFLRMIKNGTMFVCVSENYYFYRPNPHKTERNI
jgi:hypothetical protein